MHYFTFCSSNNTTKSLLPRLLKIKFHNQQVPSAYQNSTASTLTANKPHKLNLVCLKFHFSLQLRIASPIQSAAPNFRGLKNLSESTELSENLRDSPMKKAHVFSFPPLFFWSASGFLLLIQSEATRLVFFR